MTIRGWCCCLALAGALSCNASQPPRSVAPEGFIDVPGGKVFYKTMGTGDRTPLLLLHGGPGGRSCAFSVLSDLASASDRGIML